MGAGAALPDRETSVVGQDQQSPWKGGPGRGGSTALVQGEEQELCPKGLRSRSGDPDGFPKQHCSQGDTWPVDKRLWSGHCCLGQSAMPQGWQG